ncbi:MAG: alpha/beta fold hydrolase [Dongiaceae bacterium]
METISHPPQSPEASPERLGPRPYMQHLATATGAWTSSLAALPLLKNGSLPWSPQLQSDRAALLENLGNVEPQEFTAAVIGEIAARRARFESGVAAYRTHRYRRDMAAVPLLWQAGTTRLLDYRNHATDRTLPPILVVPSLVNRYYVLDLMPETSFLRWLANQGFPVFAIDWDAPGVAERGFDLTSYTTERLEPALDAVRAATNKAKPIVLGYCMGGNLALALAHRRERDLAGLALLATPWDFHAERPEQARGLGAMAAWLMPTMAAAGALPVDAIQSLFAALDPMQVIRKFLAFAELDPASDRARRFVALEDWLNDGIPLATLVAIETLAGWYGANSPATGQWRIGGTAVSPASCDLPALVVIPDTDRIVPPGSARALAATLPRATPMTPAAGHIGMMVGGRAEREVWQPIAAWLRAVP